MFPFVLGWPIVSARSPVCSGSDRRPCLAGGGVSPPLPVVLAGCGAAGVTGHSCRARKQRRTPARRSGPARLVGWLWAKHHISCGPSANRNSHAVPSGQGAAMPRATPGNRTRMAESRGKELTPRPECSPGPARPCPAPADGAEAVCPVKRPPSPARCLVGRITDGPRRSRARRYVTRRGKRMMG